jgi:glycosyltransferase involved in cell wall biosynthesis
MKLGAYAIALNEAKHALRWCEATKDFDYRLVCDTGSDDDTVALLESQGVIVHKITVRPWRFDVARNTALSLVDPSVDVLLSLDLDETLSKDFAKKVKKHWLKDATRGWTDINTGNTWKVNRLHARHGYYWKAPIHEVAMPSLDSKEVHCDIPGAVIHHEPDATKSRGKYLPMLVAGVNESPHDVRLWVYLCRELYMFAQWEMLLENAEKCFDSADKHSAGWNVELAAVCRWASEAANKLGKHLDAQKYAYIGTQYCKDEIEPWFALSMERYWTAIRLLEEAKTASEKDKKKLSKEITDAWKICYSAGLKGLECKKATHYLVIPTVRDYLTYDLVALSAYHLGKKDKAIEYGELALKGAPDDPRIAENLKWYKSE